MNQKLNYQLHQDGSVSIFYGDTCLIPEFFPGIDGGSIRPLNIQVTAGAGETSDCVEWQTASGTIRMQIQVQDDDSLGIRYTLVDYSRPISTFWVLNRNFAEQMSGMFQAGEGMAEVTRFLSKDRITEKHRVRSFGLTSLQFAHGSLTMYADDHSNYESVFVVESDSLPRACERYDFGNPDNDDPVPDRFVVSGGFRLENVNQGTVELPEIRFRWDEKMADGLETAAKEIGRNMNARLHMPPAYHWCSWYYCYHNLDMPQVREYVDGFSGMEPEIPLRYVQVDAGYCPAIGDWLLPCDRFPNTVKEAFDSIKAAGYTPGIWVGPYMVGNRSRLYKEHPDWVLYDLDGRPLRPWIYDNEPKAWGYQDEEYYALDTSHPDAMEYIVNVFKTLKSWGAGLFKTDFMYWGMQDSAKVKRHTPGKTSVQYFREFLAAIRGAIGEDSYWLGCIAPFLPFVGYADGIRIGGDVGSSWKGGFGPQNMITCLVGNNYSNHNLFQTDPDAVMLRDFHIRLNDTEINALALLAAMSGGCIYTSDLLHRIGEDRVKLFRFIEPDRRRKPYLPYLEETRPDTALVHWDDETGKGLFYLFNRTDDEVTKRYDLADLRVPENVKVFRFADGAEEISVKGGFYATIPAHGCRLFVLSLSDTEIDRGKLWNNMK